MLGAPNNQVLASKSSQPFLEIWIKIKFPYLRDDSSVICPKQLSLIIPKFSQQILCGYSGFLSGYWESQKNLHELKKESGLFFFFFFA